MPTSKIKKEKSQNMPVNSMKPANEAENTKVSIHHPGDFTKAENILPVETTIALPDLEVAETEIDESVQEMMDYLDSLPPEPDERIMSIIEKQNEKLRKKTESYELQLQDYQVADKKFQLAKKALRKAKDQKLDSEKIALIKYEKRQVKVERKHLKNKLKQEKQNLKNMRKIIRLLQLTD